MGAKLTPFIVRNGEPHQNRVQAITSSSSVDVNGGFVFIGGGSATTITLPDPTKDGIVYEFIATTAQAHIVTNASGSGFNGAGAGSDVGTFGGAIADRLRIVSYNGAWYVSNNVNVTLA